jgi:hypothetical protein
MLTTKMVCDVLKQHCAILDAVTTPTQIHQHAGSTALITAASFGRDDVVAILLKVLNQDSTIHSADFL